MTRLAYLPIAALLATGCGGPGAPEAAPAAGAVASPIINGEACGADEETSSVAVLVTASVSFGGFRQDVKTVECTGTLIAPDVVLTAAHCVDPTVLTSGFGTAKDVAYYVTSEPDLAALAEGSATFPEDTIEASGFVKNEEFSLEGEGNVDGLIEFKDVALIFLSKALPTRPEVVITKEEASQVVEGIEVDVVGWGMNKAVTLGPFDQPPKGSVGKKRCGRAFVNEVAEFEMQIGSDAASVRKCHGDSGGPTFFTVETSAAVKRRVIGITSHAYNATEDCKKGGVDTRVDAWLEWIDARMTEACDAGTRQWCKVKGIIPPSYFDAHPTWDVLGEETPDGGSPDPTRPDAGTLVAGGGSQTDGSGGDAADDGCAQAGAAALAVAGLARLLRRRSA